MSCKLEPAKCPRSVSGYPELTCVNWSWRGCPISKKYTVNQGFMSLSTSFLEYGRHVVRLRRRRAYAPTSNAASHDNHEKINSWVSFSFAWCLWGSAWLPFGPPELRYEWIQGKAKEANVVNVLLVKVVLRSKNQFLFFFRFWNTQLAKFWALSFIRRLFILSVSFGFHGPPLLTFKTDR